MISKWFVLYEATDQNFIIFTKIASKKTGTNLIFKKNWRFDYIFASSEEELQSNIDDVYATCRSFGMANDLKTKVMHVGKSRKAIRCTLNENLLEQVNQFNTIAVCGEVGDPCKLQHWIWVKSVETNRSSVIFFRLNLSLHEWHIHICLCVKKLPAAKHITMSCAGAYRAP